MHLTNRTRKRASGPQGWEFTQDGFELLSEHKRRKALAFFHDISGAISGPDAHKQVHVIGLNREFKHLPSFFCTFFQKQFLAPLFDCANEDGFASFGTPNQMIGTSELDAHLAGTPVPLFS
jgi:hypothetical protein